MGLLLISGIADNLPVFSCVLMLKSLIINTIDFSGLHAIAGVFFLEHDFWILRFTGCGLYGCCGFVVILGLLLISGVAGLLPVVSWVLIDNSLIINTIYFSGMHAFAGGFCGELGHIGVWW